MKTIQEQSKIWKRGWLLVIILFLFSSKIGAQSDTCFVPWVPPDYPLMEDHWQEGTSSWDDASYIPENVIDSDSFNFARAHIKDSGSATLRIQEEDSTIVYSGGSYIGFYVRSEAFAEEDYSGVTISTFLNGTVQESFTDLELAVDTFLAGIHIPSNINNPPRFIGFNTIRDYNQVEIHFNAAGPQVQYDVFFAVIPGPCSGELPPGLPVTWLSFDVHKKGEASALRWTIAREINNAGYEVERSVDGRHFEIIGTVAPLQGGDATVVYGYMDEKPWYGINQYRIKQVDFDGRVSYSPVRALNFNQEGISIEIWPNPATDQLNIRFTEETEPGEVRLVNASGLDVVKQTFAENDHQATIDVDDLFPGIYTVIIGNGSSIYTQQIMVVR